MTDNQLGFSWKQFWITFIYENLPPVFVSPIAAICIERSKSRAWYVCQNRNLFAVSRECHPTYFLVFSWLLVYPSSWLITAGFFITLFGETDTIQIDSYQIVLAYMFLFMRRLIISVKYAYYTPEEIERLSLPAPEWTHDQGNRKLVGIGWSSPNDYPGLIESEVDFSLKASRNDAGKSKVSLQIASVADKEQTKNDEREIQTELLNNIEVSVKTLLSGIIKKAYAEKKPRAYDAYVTIMALAIAILPPLLHNYLYPNSFTLFGDNLISNMGRFFACMSGIGIMGFGLVCAFDFKRRYEALKLLRNLVKPSGLDLSSLSAEEIDVKELREKPYTLRLTDPRHVIAFMEIRNCIVRFGEQFYLRIQGYTSILILFAVFAVIMLNSIIWTRASHHSTTIVMIVLIILAIGSISLYAMFSAIRLQKLRVADIDFLRTECLLMEGLNPADEKDNNTQLKRSKSISVLGRAIDTAIFHDLTHAPTGILGQVADNKLITSILGILITGCLLAIQGFVEIGISYDALGWSI